MICIVLSSWQNHCESSLDEYGKGARWPPTFGPSQSACGYYVYYISVEKLCTLLTLAICVYCSNL